MDFPICLCKDGGVSYLSGGKTLHQVILISIYDVFLLAIRNQVRKCFRDKKHMHSFFFLTSLFQMRVDSQKGSPHKGRGGTHLALLGNLFWVPPSHLHCSIGGMGGTS